MCYFLKLAQRCPKIKWSSKNKKIKEISYSGGNHQHVPEEALSEGQENGEKWLRTRQGPGKNRSFVSW